MAIGRQGVMFTIMAIILVAFVISSERALNPRTSLQKVDTDAANARVSLMNSFSTTFEQHAARSLTTAGYFALKNISAKVKTDVGFIDRTPDDINVTVNDCIWNNTINLSGTYVDCLPESYRVDRAIDVLVDLANAELSIDTDYYIHQVGVSEEDPLEVTFWMVISYNISDSFASWVFDKRIVRADVDVTGVEDPLYAYLFATGETTEERNFSLTEFRLKDFNPTNFTAFYNNKSYLYHEDKSPSVLQRYTGNLLSTSVCCGVETVMDRSELVLPPPDKAYWNYSMIDHMFATHVSGALPLFDCEEEEILGMLNPPSGPEILTIDAFRFRNVFNLSGEERPLCDW